jgi:GTP-sensing pleiotropic transcriptional regulator CodY
MITGYERQHRKNFSYVPCEGADPQTTDQYTTLITHASNAGNIHEQKSKAKELAAISGMVLVQPYLDFTGNDQAQGELKIKVWEYNAFLVDPYFRSPDMSDAQFVWCQEYISKKEAENRFPDKLEQIAPMAGTPQRYGSFYFLPENYNMARNDLMVLSYVWYKWKRKKKRLYSRTRNQFFDFAASADLEQILYNIPDMEEVSVEVPTWKLAVILNDQLMFQGDNPMGFDTCPFVPYYWNYEPHQTYYDLRVRSLVRTMRDPQFLFNFKVITNNDIAAATINAGWKRKVGAVANEDNLKKSGQGWDVIINEGYDMTDVEKIIPSAVPESDLALADQMKALMFETSGINIENWSGQEDKQVSSLTVLLKQAANLMVFQKYFDQWDLSDKLLGDRLLQIVLNNWNAEKVKLYIGSEPSPFFYSKIFSKYQTIVEESDLTPTQQNLQAQQMMDINAAFGREVFTPSQIVPKLNITGKAEVINILEQQEQQAAQMQNDAQMVKHAIEDAKLKELYSKSVANISMARERMGRTESNLGLYEERLSMIEKNRSMSLKEKQAALTSLLENIHRFGEIETSLKQNDLESLNFQQIIDEENEKRDVERRTEANKFLMEIIGGMGINDHVNLSMNTSEVI